MSVTKNPNLNLSAEVLQQDHSNLVTWYKKNRRALPWRSNKDPYRIWISEIMLQQTTVTAVIPYYEKFLAKFPDVHQLANASLESVLENWAGLGYYSRARNLHKAAKHFSANGFPKTAAELIQAPGLGPYTSRAVASIAFDEKVGVLDGNVIRVLSRKHGLALDWWKPKGREILQHISDELALIGESSALNQGLMELGASVCTPTSPTCLLCPWLKTCVAHAQDRIQNLPSKKPRKKSEVWIWEIDIQKKSNALAMIQNDYAPFLKGQLIFPGTVSHSEKKPKDYLVKHQITHHEIFVVAVKSKIKTPKNSLQWIEAKNLKKVSPSSLLTKILVHLDLA